jgi:hypothetical protein
MIDTIIENNLHAVLLGQGAISLKKFEEALLIAIDRENSKCIEKLYLVGRDDKLVGMDDKYNFMQLCFFIIDKDKKTSFKTLVSCDKKSRWEECEERIIDHYHIEKKDISPFIEIAKQITSKNSQKLLLCPEK